MPESKRMDNTPARIGGRAAFLRRPGGFSLLELIVVMAIISIIAGTIAPVFGGSISTVQFRNSRNDFIAMVQFVQELAVRDSREYRVYINPKENSYWVEKLVAKDGAEKTFEPATQAFLAKQQLPDYIDLTQVKARKDREEKGIYIGCYPNGASDEAQITMVDKRNRGRKVRIAVAGTLGDVSVTREK